MQDLRFAVRQLLRRPGFTITALLSLGVGVGATTTIFNVAEVTLVRPLPFEHQERLVRVYRIPEAGTPRISLRPPTYAAVARDGSFFDRIVAQRYTTLVRATETGPERVVGIAVTARWAETLGLAPELGRSFSPEEERRGAGSRVVLLSHAAWESWFAADPGALGRQVVLDGEPYAVVGVMPPGIRFPYEADLWMPMRAEDAQVGPWSFNVLARLRPGVGPEEARTDLRRIAREAAASGEAPALQEDGMSLTAVPLREVFVQDEARTTLALLGGVGFLLLVVCANLANLLLAKGLGRSREMAVRTSLGASRRRIFRQLLTESLLLGTLGSGLGIVLAGLGSSLAGPLLPQDFAYVDAGVTMNGTVLAFGAGLALVSTLLFGLLPAARVSRGGSGPGALRSTGGSAGPSARRLTAGLMVTEVAFAIVLLSGAGLMLRDLQRLTRLDLGYEPATLATFSLSLSGAPYDRPEVRTDLVARATDALRSIQGVAAAGVTTMFPSSGGNALAHIEIQGRADPPGRPTLVNHRLVGPGYFDALGIAVMAGRGITDRDRAQAAPVVVVSRAAAERFWPDRSPLGEQVRRPEGGEDAWMTVVGVVDDVREFWDVEETWYLPLAQHAAERSASSITVVVAGARALPPADEIRRTLSRVSPDLPVIDLLSARELHRAALTRQRHSGVLAAAFAFFGLFLAVMGVYGAVSYSVSRRTREFGLRMALGGAPRSIVGGVMREAFRLVGLGCLLGVGGAVAVSGALGRVLTEIPGFDPYTLAASILILAAAALAATLLPALRAAHVDPMDAMRRDG